MNERAWGAVSGILALLLGACGGKVGVVTTIESQDASPPVASPIAASTRSTVDAFACGTELECDRTVSYCEADGTGIHPTWTCLSLPFACRSTGGKIPDCTCFPPPPPCADPQCFQQCSASPDPVPAFTVTIGK